MFDKTWGKKTETQVIELFLDSTSYRAFTTPTTHKLLANPRNKKPVMMKKCIAQSYCNFFFPYGLSMAVFYLNNQWQNKCSFAWILIWKLGIFMKQDQIFNSRSKLVVLHHRSLNCFMLLKNDNQTDTQANKKSDWLD